MHSIKTADVQADFQILVSIYNPNMLDATIETGTAILYHKHTEVRARVHTARFSSSVHIYVEGFMICTVRT